jgi:hypothetical protein
MTRQRAPGHTRRVGSLERGARKFRIGPTLQGRAPDARGRFYTRSEMDWSGHYTLVFPNPVLTPRTGSSLATTPSTAVRSYLNCRNRTHGHFVAPRALCRSFGDFIMSSSGFESLDRKPVVVGAGDLDKAREQ